MSDCQRITLNQQSENLHFAVQPQQECEVVLVYQDDVTVNVSVEQAANSRFKLTEIALGANNINSAIKVNLIGEEACCDLQGAIIVSQQQKVMSNIIINHQAAHCQSDINYRNIADDKAELAVAARVVVAEGAAKTFSEMSLRSILLSKLAIVDALPELEIYHDDVKCSHGATVGSLDEKALFYLLSRGIDENTAHQMLLQAFMKSIERYDEYC